MSELITSGRRLDDPENRKQCVAELERAMGVGGGKAAESTWVGRWGAAIRALLLDSAAGEEGFEPW